MRPETVSYTHLDVYKRQVFVDSDVRGLGVGNAMVGQLVTALEDLGIGRVLLATRDAHEVYARLGFEPLANPTFWMERDRRPQRFVPGTAPGGPGPG